MPSHGDNPKLLRDPNRRIQSATDVASGETITYQYDSLNRLIQAGGNVALRA
jgi:hypothetical protein